MLLRFAQLVQLLKHFHPLIASKWSNRIQCRSVKLLEDTASRPRTLEQGPRSFQSLQNLRCLVSGRRRVLRSGSSSGERNANETLASKKSLRADLTVEGVWTRIRNYIV
jgi:hypothetical protein